MPDISVYSSSTVSDKPAVARLSEFDIHVGEYAAIIESTEFHLLSISVYEATAVSESTSRDLTRTISSYESVSIAEDVDFADTLGWIVGMGEMLSYPRMPVRYISAEFNRVFESRTDLLMPARSLQGYFGGALSKTQPVRSLVASISQNDYPMTVSGYMPVRTLSAYFGSSVSGKMPVLELEASFAGASVFTLDGRLPVWSIEASFLPGTSLELNAKIPVWTIAASLVESGFGMSLDEEIPGAFLLSATMILEQVMSLDSVIPMWRLTSTMYESGMNLDVKIPVWIVENVTDTKMQYLSRFSDYILRYTRP